MGGKENLFFFSCLRFFIVKVFLTFRCSIFVLLDDGNAEESVGF